MKGGQSGRICGRRFSFTVAALVITAIFLLTWENNPLLISLLSAQEQFIRHTPEFWLDDSAESLVLMNPKEHMTDEDPFPQLGESKEDDKIVKHSDSAMDSANILSTERKDEMVDEDSVSQLAESKEDDKIAKHSDSAMDREDMLSTEREDENGVLASSLEKQAACNYGKGRWVADVRRPLYSGFGCKPWLSDMWACRLTQRTDFSYEGYRWQPNNCEMPEFQGAEFLRRMQDKTIAFIGDSLGRQQFQSLLCMVSGGEEIPQVENLERKYGLIKPRGSIRPDGWAFRFPNTNTTILYYWSASLCGIEPINITDPATDFAMHLDRPPAFLKQFLPNFDVVILNTGHHWNRGKLRGNRWVMYANGNPVAGKLAEMGNAKNYTLYSIARWLDSQIRLRPQLKVFLRTISPRHFFHGDWNTGGSCDNMAPLSKGSEVSKDESSDPVVEGAVKGTNVKILDITALSELRDEGHISRYSIKASVGINDCLHWCLPGIPDTWNELLCAQV